MDWKVFTATFGMLFLAELGDKTQLAVITMTGKSGAPVSVFLGAVAALAVVTLIGVIFGDAITRVVPPNVLHTGAALLFIGFGVAMLLGKM